MKIKINGQDVPLIWLARGPADGREFSEATLDILREIERDCEDPEVIASATDEWSRKALELDTRAVKRAIELHQAGKRIYFASDEDGYYFATE